MSFHQKQIKNQEKRYENFNKKTQQLIIQPYGLPNIRNTCFLATAIQILYSSQSFRIFLFKQQFNESQKWLNLLKTLLSQLFNKDQNRKYRLMQEISFLLKKQNPQYNLYQQQDCLFYLNRIIECLNQQNNYIKQLFYFDYYRICQKQLNHPKDQINLDFIQDQIYLNNKYQKCAGCMIQDNDQDVKIFYLMFKKSTNILVGNGVKSKYLYFLQIPIQIKNSMKRNQINKKSYKREFTKGQLKKQDQDQLVFKQQKFHQLNHKILRYKLKGYVNYSGTGNYGHYTATRKRLLSYIKQSEKFYIFNDQHIYEQIQERYPFYKQQNKYFKHQLSKKAGFASLYQLVDQLDQQTFRSMGKQFQRQKDEYKDLLKEAMTEDQYLQIIKLIQNVKQYQLFLNKQDKQSKKQTSDIRPQKQREQIINQNQILDGENIIDLQEKTNQTPNKQSFLNCNYFCSSKDTQRSNQLQAQLIGKDYKNQSLRLGNEVLGKRPSNNQQIRSLVNQEIRKTQTIKNNEVGYPHKNCPEQTLNKQNKQILEQQSLNSEENASNSWLVFLRNFFLCRCQQNKRYNKKYSSTSKISPVPIKEKKFKVQMDKIKISHRRRSNQVKNNCHVNPKVKQSHMGNPMDKVRQQRQRNYNTKQQ